MPLEIGGRIVPTDDEGYLINPDDWSDSIAEGLARLENVELTREHWIAIRFMREYYEDHQIAPDSRHVIKHLAQQSGRGEAGRNDLFKLFPYGYVKQACKIAGMRRPRAWSTG
jgi:tRNA 2-thiouridine synthesizing protein E